MRKFYLYIFIYFYYVHGTGKLNNFNKRVAALIPFRKTSTNTILSRVRKIRPWTIKQKRWTRSLVDRVTAREMKTFAGNDVGAAARSLLFVMISPFEK